MNSQEPIFARSAVKFGAAIVAAFGIAALAGALGAGHTLRIVVGVAFLALYGALAAVGAWGRQRGGTNQDSKLSG